MPMPMAQRMTGAITGEAAAARKPPLISLATNPSTPPSRIRDGPVGRGRIRLAAPAATAIMAACPNNRAGRPRIGAAVAAAMPRICPPNWASEANPTACCTPPGATRLRRASRAGVTKAPMVPMPRA